MQAYVTGQRIERDPHFFGERLYSDQFRVLYFVGAQLFISAYHHAESQSESSQPDLCNKAVADQKDRFSL